MIFTNQKGISTGNTNPEHIKTKVANIAAEIGIEMQVFMAPQDDQYRKPGVGMWECLTRNNGGIPV